jgi:hypothetical protein
VRVEFLGLLSAKKRSDFTHKFHKMEYNYTISYGFTEETSIMIKLSGLEEQAFPGLLLYRAHFAEDIFQKVSYFLDINKADAVYIFALQAAPGSNLVPKHSAYVRIQLSDIPFADKLFFEFPISLASNTNILCLYNT